MLFSPPHYLSSSHTPVFFSFLFRSLPWTFSCIRSYIVVPDTRLARKYVLIYDMVITQPHFRNHVLLQVFSGQGFFNSEFFTIMLIDIVTINEKLVTIMSAVVLHGNALAMVFYMFCTITVIFAVFGVRYFAVQPVEEKTVELYCSATLVGHQMDRVNRTSEVCPAEQLGRALFCAAYGAFGLGVFPSSLASDAGQYVVAGQRSQAQLRMKARARRDDVAPRTRRTFRSSLGGRVVTTAPAARPVSQATPKPCSRSPLLRPKSCPRLFWRRAETSGSSFCSESSTTRSSLHISAFWLCQLDLHAEFTAARCSSGWHHASLL